MHCMYYRIRLWRHHFIDGSDSKQLHQAPVLGEDTAVIYLHSCDLNTNFDFTVPSLQFLSLNVVFGLLIFVISLVERHLKYMLTAKRRILHKLDGVRFLFIVQVIEKAQKKAQFSFCGQRKVFHYEIVLRGIQSYFLHCGERLVCFEMQARQRRFGEFWGTFLTLWSRKLRC